jgi:hypothetical protein
VDGRKKEGAQTGQANPYRDRVQFLTMMHPGSIADIRQVDIDEHRAAWDVMEQAAREFLKRRKSRRTR